jgi:hydrogenase/urease accessory protein HupE
MRGLAWLAAVWLMALAGVQRVTAHELKLALLEFRETEPEVYSVLWKTPGGSDLRQTRPRLPAAATVISAVERETYSDSESERYLLRCPGGIEGKPLTLEGSTKAIFDVLVRLVRRDGSTEILRMTPDRPMVELERAPSPWKQAMTFFRLGLEHILMGVDHLLFVLGLLVIVRNRMMLLKTITAFTLAHSLTLGAATLGWVHVPAMPLNAAIALSILFLGPEMVRVHRGESSFTIEHPWLVAFVFGLLHGIGFAGGLTALGLSRGEIPFALLLFNLGVEAGQLFFVGIILLLAASFRTLQIRWTRWAEYIPAYTVGGLGAYWTIQRTFMIFTSPR